VIHGFTLVLTLDLIFFTIFAVVMMFSIDPFMALLSILIFPFLPPKILKIARKEHDLHLVAQEELSTLSQAVTQTLSSLRFNRATDSEEVKAQILTKHARDYADRRLAVVETGWKIYPLSALPTLIAYGILLGVGVLQVSRGLLTIGEFVALQSYVLMLQGPLLELGDCIAEWQKGFASLGRIQEIIGLKDRVDRRHWHEVSAAELTQERPILRIKGVSFRYGSEGDWVLNNIDLSIKPGEWAGLTGPIGAGKTTLIHLCAGLLPFKQGRVDIGGRDINTESNQWLRSQITVMTQRSFLFASTIRSNLCLDLAFTDDQLWEVLEKVGLAEDFARLPHKLEEVLGESGVNLSGGQRQRLAFARALLRLNPVLLIDDALSAVDAHTEAKILEAIKPMLQDKTVLWAAHRASTLSLCHRAYHLERGVLTL
jgi:ATP-binding cassette subfamily B protein